MKSKTIWFTGLPCSGKTTLARNLHQSLTDQGVSAFLLDGDDLRKGLSSDLGFTPEDRAENLRRAAEVARLIMNSGLHVLATFISPFERDRARVRSIIGQGQFVEVFVQCAPEVCERRDVKGMYRKAREGVILNFTGISSPYETPLVPEVVISTEDRSVSDSIEDLNLKLKPFLSLHE